MMHDEWLSYGCPNLNDWSKTPEWFQLQPIAVTNYSEKKTHCDKVRHNLAHFHHAPEAVSNNEDDPSQSNPTSQRKRTPNPDDATLRILTNEHL